MCYGFIADGIISKWSPGANIIVLVPIINVIINNNVIHCLLASLSLTTNNTRQLFVVVGCPGHKNKEIFGDRWYDGGGRIIFVVWQKYIYDKIKYEWHRSQSRLMLQQDTWKSRNKNTKEIIHFCEKRGTLLWLKLQSALKILLKLFWKLESII